VKIALVTTLPDVRSGIGDYTRHLLPYLREHVEVDLYVEHVEGDDPWPGETVRVVDDLQPAEYDQVLYQLGNEQHHGFMARMIRCIGGTVMQHDWVLFDQALTAWPALVRGGWKGHLLALREGGLAQARLYARNWLDRRAQRTRVQPPSDGVDIEGTLLSGWHGAEESGRWTSDHASFRIPARGVERVRVELHVDAGRDVCLTEGTRQLAKTEEAGENVLLSAPLDPDEPVLSIDTTGIVVTPQQRASGDSRRLGCFVHRITWNCGERTQQVDLSAPAAVPVLPVTLSRDRFELPLNRSVVRFADAFIVHSEYVKRHIVSDRNATTPIGILHHGSERRWSDDDPREMRREMGLPEAWTDGFLVTSFGGVQAHKRVDKLLEGLALARSQRDDIYLVLAGSLHAENFSPHAKVAELGLEEFVHFTGFVTEEDGWCWLHAGNVAVNLRGPTSGGTSGGVFQAFSIGRPVIASDAAEQCELPSSCVLKVPLGEGEPEAIARTLVELRDDPARLQELNAAARRFVEEECHWSLMARRYAEYMDGFPRPRGDAKSVAAMRLSLDSWRAAMQRMHPHTFRK
jgi:glycosyltransferase involved in cell wall biosynthesis